MAAHEAQHPRYEVQHPHWGSNLVNQIVAHAWKGKGNRGDYNVTTEQYSGFFGGTKTREKKEYVGTGWVLTNDDNEDAKRQYRHRCGLLKIVMTPHRNGPMFVVFLDGHVMSNFVSGEMEFRFVPEDLKENDGKPIAEVWFHGKGKRHGPLHEYGTSRIICTFADKEQMDQYLDLTNRRMPKSITHDGVTYSSTSGGQYQSSDGSILPYLLVMYFLLSPNEQQVFAAQNPEVQSMLGDTTQDASIADGPDGVVNQTPAEGTDYGDGGDHSGGADFGGSDAGGSDTGGGDSGGGGDGGGGE